jgi:hypothetical protein
VAAKVIVMEATMALRAGTRDPDERRTGRSPLVDDPGPRLSSLPRLALLLPPEAGAAET